MRDWISVRLRVRVRLTFRLGIGVGVSSNRVLYLCGCMESSALALLSHVRCCETCIQVREAIKELLPCGSTICSIQAGPSTRGGGALRTGAGENIAA